MNDIKDLSRFSQHPSFHGLEECFKSSEAFGYDNNFLYSKLKCHLAIEQELLNQILTYYNNDKELIGEAIRTHFNMTATFNGFSTHFSKNELLDTAEKIVEYSSIRGAIKGIIKSLKDK